MRWLSRSALVLAFAAIAVCFGIAHHRAGRADRSAHAGTSSEATDRHTRDAENAAESKREQIRAEVNRREAHPWAGEYYAGDGLGVNTVILLAPNAGYVFEWHGCLGVYDRNYGSIIEKDRKLTLGFTFENSREGFRGVAPELTPVTWGARRYLIPSDDLVGFCNHVNQGAEPRSGSHGFYFLRRGDESKAVTGSPKLPPGFHDYLLPSPVEAIITTVGASATRLGLCELKFKDTQLNLDAGKRRGLKVGMELVVTDPDHLVERVKITNVEDDRSEAVMTQVGDERPGPKVGWRLCTRAPWHSSNK